MEHIKIITMTCVLTALIWATADSLVNETTEISVRIQFSPAAGDPRMLIIPREPDIVYKVELAGPRRFTGQVPKTGTVKLQVNDRADGVHKLDVRELVAEQWRDHPKLAIVAVTPQVAELTIDHTTTADARVVLKASPRLLFDQQPRLDNATVKCEMRQSALNRAQEQGRALQLEIDVDRVLRGQPLGRSVTVTVPLTPDPEVFGEGVRFNPGEVKVTATLKADRRSAEITTCPIQLAVGFAHFGRRYQIEDDKGPITLMTRSITVTGPSEAIDKLLAGDRPVGIIRLRAEDFERGDTLQIFRPEFHLPPDIELAKEPEPVAFKLVEIP